MDGGHEKMLGLVSPGKGASRNPPWEDFSLPKAGRKTTSLFSSPCLTLKGKSLGEGEKVYEQHSTFFFP